MSNRSNRPNVSESPVPVWRDICRCIMQAKLLLGYRWPASDLIDSYGHVALNDPASSPCLPRLDYSYLVSAYSSLYTLSNVWILCRHIPSKKIRCMNLAGIFLPACSWLASLRRETFPLQPDFFECFFFAFHVFCLMIWRVFSTFSLLFDVQCIFRPENGLQDRQDIPVSSQLNLHAVYVSDGSWSWIRWYVVNDSRKQQVLVVAQSFLDRLGHLGPVELARDQCGKDRDAKCAEVYGHGPSHQCSRHFRQRCQYMASSIVACLEGAFRAIFSEDPHTFGLKLISKDRRVTFCALHLPQPVLGRRSY